MPAGDKRKIAVVGTGWVGASAAYALLISGLANELVLVDKDQQKAVGEAMDLAHGAPFVSPVRVYAGDYADCQDADIIVYAAGVGQKPGETRLDLAHNNVMVLKQVLPNLLNPDGNTVLLMVSNPVDLLTYAAIRIAGISPQRIMGTGTVLDSSRFRYLISERCRVEARNIHAYVVGEHGDSEVPLWSLANIAGIKVKDFCTWQGTPCLDQEKISAQVRRAGYDIIEKKGATYYAIGLAVRRICESILRDENSILTVSGLVQGQYGIKDICLSLPCMVNRSGRVRILEVPLNPEEEAALKKSAQMLKSVRDELQL